MKRSNYNIFFILFLLFNIITGCKSQMPKPVMEINIPKLENFTLDGNADDWNKIKAYKLWADPLGRYTETSDLDTEIKIAWNQDKILLSFQVFDDCFVSDSIAPWKGDAIEIFLSPFRGSADILQISLIQLSDKDFILISDHSENTKFTPLSKSIKSISRLTGNLRFTELELDFLPGTETTESFNKFALQVYVNDADSVNDLKNQLVWYPVGQSYNSSSSMFTVKTSEEKQSEQQGASRLVITDNKRINLYVFGGTTGDIIGIYKNDKFLKNYKSVTKNLAYPDSLDISEFGWDIENDSLYVTLNGKSLSFHELFLAPRIYETLIEKRFDREIRNFIFTDRQSEPKKNATLFIGSSSIVRWSRLSSDFPELTIIKRGFGGSTSPEALMYINKIVLPYEPANIVYYEGDNDIAMGFSSIEIRDNVKAFIDTVSKVLPETRIYILSPKPSINRMHLWDKYKETQLMLKMLCDNYTMVEYVDVSSPMFYPDGKLNNSIFVEDGIHMNETGYAIWKSIIRKALKLD